MAYSAVQTATMIGTEIVPVSVEVDLRPGLPQFRIIGLPDKQIEEARERVRSAIKNSSLEFPQSRLTVNLSPSDVPKSGTGFDLAIALAVLSAAGKRGIAVPGCWAFGELSLDGRVLPFQRLLALLVGAARHVKLAIAPVSDADVPMGDLRLLTVSSLAEVVHNSRNPGKFVRPSHSEKVSPVRSEFQLDAVRGQIAAKRALMISLAGAHNLLLSGPPGGGKTMLARAACELLPDLNAEERREVLTLHADSRACAYRPPIQAPHHTSSLTAMIGGGPEVRPGAVTLAHRGILFLDEFPEFRRDVREALRQPLQDRSIQIVRQGRIFTMPADCLVIAVQNECPCGAYGTPQCRCTMAEIIKYERRISAPLLDRFSLFVQVPKADLDTKRDDSAPSGKQLSDLILQVRRVQAARGQSELNGRLSVSELKRYALPSMPVQNLLDRVRESYSLSMRGLNSLLSVARTIADLIGEPEVAMPHVQEALQYRRRMISGYT